MSRIALFAGPSLPQPLPPLVRDIALRPPAACGDLLRAATDGFDVVALVDGVFETGPSVWHKEILHLLARGVAVYGAASLGAIRAAELEGFGMVGIGTVFAGYRSGAIERDDAVMVAHAPAAFGYRALTLALVDAEVTILAAALACDDRDALLGLARSCPFRRRDWPTLFDAFDRRFGRDRGRAVRAAIPRAMRSVKQADTALLLDALGDSSPPATIAPPPSTPFLERLLLRVAAR